MTRWTIEVEDDVAERVADAAAERGIAPEELAREAVTEKFSSRRRRLAFAAVGGSGSAQGGAEADDLLAEGFGRSPAC
jgi:hypothetical protein